MQLSLASRFFVTCVAVIAVVSPEPHSSVSLIITRTYNLICLMKANTTVLINTYHRYEGSLFSERSFSVEWLQYNGVPTAAIPFLKWRTLTDMERLDQNYRAYSTFLEFLQLVSDDQLVIHSQETELLQMLRVTQMHIQGLLSNLSSIMSALGAPLTLQTNLLMLEATEANTFEKKIRGYVVCYRYSQWVNRTVQDFSLLVTKYQS